MNEERNKLADQYMGIPALPLVTGTLPLVEFLFQLADPYYQIHVVTFHGSMNV